MFIFRCESTVRAHKAGIT